MNLRYSGKNTRFLSHSRFFYTICKEGENMEELIAIGWLLSLMTILISALIYQLPRVPEGFVYTHLILLVLPIMMAVFGLMYFEPEVLFGTFQMDIFNWVLALYVSILNFVIQRFSIRYLHGDKNYRKYFLLFTWISGTTSITWMIDNIFLFSVIWIFPFLGLVLLTRLNKEWKPANIESKQMEKIFFLSFLAVFFAVYLLHYTTGKWYLSEILMGNFTNNLLWQETFIINLLIVLSAVILAGQWPFHRWLIESAVIPTPVSAIMHAGLVNAGALLIWKFYPLFTNIYTHVFLLIIAFISIVIGVGINLVHVDYKRQLVASTMAQMGLMLVQCALGAYSAAIIHLMLHGFFKATLFLQSGNAVPRPEYIGHIRKWSRFDRMFGIFLGISVGLLFWNNASEEPTRLISSLLLTASVAIGWGRLSFFRESRWIAALCLAGFAFLSEKLRERLMYLFQQSVELSFSLPLWVEWFVLILFLLFTAFFFILFNKRSSKNSYKFYLWLVALGEPKLTGIYQRSSKMRKE